MDKVEFLHDLKTISEKAKQLKDDFNKDFDNFIKAVDNLFEHFLKEERKEIRDERST